METDFESYPDRGAVRFRAVRDFGDIINATFRFLTDHVRPLALGQLYVAGPALVLVTASLVLFGGAELFNPAGAFSSNPEDVFAGISPLIIVTFVAYLLAALLSFAAAYGMVMAYRRDELEELRGADVWDEARPTLLPILGVMGLMVGILVLCVPVLLIPCLGALVVFGAALYFLPALYLVYAVRLFEGGGALAALKRAVALMKEDWGRSFGTLFVGGIISYVLSLVVSIPGAVLSVSATVAGVEGGVLGTVLLAAGSVFQLLALLVSNTFLVVLTCFLHGSLKEAAEGTLLDDDLERLAAGAASLDEVLHDAGDPLRDRPDDDRFRPSPPEPPAPEAPDADRPDGDRPSGDAPRGDLGEDRGGFRGGGFGA